MKAKIIVGLVSILMLCSIPVKMLAQYISNYYVTVNGCTWRVSGDVDIESGYVRSYHLYGDGPCGFFEIYGSVAPIEPTQYTENDIAQLVEDKM